MVVKLNGMEPEWEFMSTGYAQRNIRVFVYEAYNGVCYTEDSLGHYNRIQCAPRCVFIYVSYTALTTTLDRPHMGKRERSLL